MLLRAIAAALTVTCIFAQGGGRGGPPLTEAQQAAVARMNTAIAPRVQALNTARVALTQASLGQGSLDGAADAVRDAEIALAKARVDAMAAIPGLPQGAGGGGRGGGGGGQNGNTTVRTTIPRVREAQVQALTRLTEALMPLTKTLNAARAAVTSARGDAEIKSRAEAVRSAELAVARTRAEGFAKIQASANRLEPDQVAAFAGMGGTFANVPFTLPDPMDPGDHTGYVSLFDGATLKGWDGNPKFWRAEAGAIVGESTPQNPSGNSYLVYRDMVAKDFTLKFEMKVEGSGGSGFQYRSKTGIPWLANIADNVTANVGPVNLNWMMTGPQADFWPASANWTGQFYSENTPMRILAWRGQVVEGAGMARKQLMGNIGDRAELNKVVKMDDWNQYTVIARGGTCMHIVNGQLMAVYVDDDPESSNNQPGLFGIEIEATTKIQVRNIWVKKLN